MCLKCSLFGIQSACETEICHYSTRLLEIPCTVISPYFENEDSFLQIFIEVKSRRKEKICMRTRLAGASKLYPSTQCFYW